MNEPNSNPDPELDRVFFKSQEYDCLILSGGAIRGIYELGALSHLLESGALKLSSLKVVAATSIGSVIGTLLLCGYDMFEIFCYMLKEEVVLKDEDGLNLFKKGRERFSGHITKLWTLLSEYGLYDISILSENLGRMIEDKLGKIPTFSEFKKITGKTLIVTVSNFTESKVEYFSHKNEPDLCILDAIKMSCNIPLLFKKIKYKNCLYIDGGMLDNFPVSIINLEKYKTIGLVIKNKQRLKEKDVSLIDYVHGCLSLPIQRITSLMYDKQSTNPKIIELESEVSTLNFSLSYEVKMQMFVSGATQAKTQLESSS
jgi:NTE family protein